MGVKSPSATVVHLLKKENQTMNNYETILRLLAEKESLQERVKGQWEEYRKYDYECFSMSHTPMFLGSDTPYTKRKYIMEELGYIEDEIKKVDGELGNIPEYSSQTFWDKRLKEEGLPLVKTLGYSLYTGQPNQGNKSALKRMVSVGVDALMASSRDPDDQVVALSDSRLQVLSEFEQVASPYTPGCRRTKPTSSDCPQTFEGSGLFN